MLFDIPSNGLSYIRHTCLERTHHVRPESLLHYESNSTPKIDGLSLRNISSIQSILSTQATLILKIYTTVTSTISCSNVRRWGIFHLVATTDVSPSESTHKCQGRPHSQGLCRSQKARVRLMLLFDASLCERLGVLSDPFNIFGYLIN